MTYSFEVCTIAEMDNRVKNIKLQEDPFTSPKYVGFKYFSPEHVYRSSWSRRHLPEDQFFLAYKEGEIVGVCLVQKSPLEEETWWISYIDTHFNHKREGVAKGLYGAINEWVNPTMIIYGSRLSLEGREADLHQVRKKIITRCKCFATAEDFYYDLEAQQAKVV
jgi:hypothetical protein